MSDIAFLHGLTNYILRNSSCPPVAKYHRFRNFVALQVDTQGLAALAVDGAAAPFRTLALAFRQQLPAQGLYPLG